jgi:hypothetical protein
MKVHELYPFDVILFDVGGVLLTNGWDHDERALVTEGFHLDFEALRPVIVSRISPGKSARLPPRPI